MPRKPIDDLPSVVNLPDGNEVIMPIFKSLMEPYPIAKISISQLVDAIAKETLKHKEVKLFINMETGALTFRGRK
jgi:hypothetical protein